MPIARSLRTCCAVPLAAVLAVAVAAACSSSSPTGPHTSQIVHVLSRFDTLHNTTADPERADAFLNIAKFLAEGAPLGSGLIKNGDVTGRFSMVAALIVDDVDGRPVDSQYTVIGYEGNAPDSVVVFQATSTNVFSLVSDHTGSIGTIGGTVSITPDAPGAACTSLLAQAPSDLGAPTPITCHLETVQASFTTPVAGSGDTIQLPNQPIAGIRFERASPPV